MERKDPDTPMNGKSMTRQAELEELRRRIAARKAAAEQGTGHGGGCRERGNRREKCHPAMERIAEFAYMCAPAACGLLVLLLGAVAVRAMAVMAVGNMRTGPYAWPVLAAGYAADLADPFADSQQAERLPEGAGQDFLDAVTAKK